MRLSAALVLLLPLAVVLGCSKSSTADSPGKAGGDKKKLTTGFSTDTTLVGEQYRGARWPRSFALSLGTRPVFRDGTTTSWLWDEVNRRSGEGGSWTARARFRSLSALTHASPPLTSAAASAILSSLADFPQDVTSGSLKGAEVVPHPSCCAPTATREVDSPIATRQALASLDQYIIPHRQTPNTRMVNE
jgi:hypothetical protein